MAAVLHQEAAWAVTPAARSRGLEPGMRRGTLTSLVPGLMLKNRDPAAELRFLRRLAGELSRYTPSVAFNPSPDPCGLLLEISASLSLFQGPRNLCRLIHAALARQQAPHYRLSMAPTAQGAQTLAEQGRTRLRRALKLSTLRRRLDPLPLALLPSCLEHQEWLEGLGCHTLAQLRALPRAGVSQRSSPGILQALDAAYGHIPEVHAWFTPPELFSVRHELVTHLEHAHAILAATERLVNQLCGWLYARHCAADTLVLHLHHEKGRQAAPPERLVLALSQAGWQPRDFMPALAERLGRATLACPVIALELSIPAALSRPAPAASLFPEPAQWQADELRLLDLLRARLDEGQVLEPRPRADYRPELANAWVPAGAPQAPARSHSPKKQPDTPDFLPPRPFWMITPPQALETRNDHPVYKNAVLRLVRGPERLEGGWWEEGRGMQRDYFIAQDAAHARYWIYRQREPLQARWFLHGLFG